MLGSFASWLGNLLYRKGRRSRIVYAALFLSIISPVFLVMSASYLKLKQDFTSSALSRRQSIADLAAAVLKEKFDRLRDIGISITARPSFRRMVSDGRWTDAIETLKRIPADYPFVDRVFLTDISGNQMEAYPRLFGGLGKNLAFQDWYQGVKKKRWRPYVSEVYKRTAAPQYNVVALAVPIRSESHRVVGILVLQVRVDTFVRWAKAVRVGSSGHIYFVDRKGHIAGHPRFRDNEGIVDGSKWPIIQKVLKDRKGVEVLLDPIEKEEGVIAYAPVSYYGWGVIASQPRKDAFEIRGRSLRYLQMLYGFVFLLTCLLAFMVLQATSALIRKETEIAHIHAEREQLELFAFAASHDLQEPLQKIASFSALLEPFAHELKDEKVRHYLDRLRNAAGRMSQMIEDLRKFSRVRKSEEFSKINLNGVLQEVVDSLGSEIKETGASVEVRKLPPIHGDASQLFHLFQNLVGNALKYRKKDRTPRVVVSGEPVGDAFAEIRVQDNGIGFDQKFVDKIFAPFKRLHTQSQFAGSGIGLAICKRIALMHGGSITAESSEGKGSTFVVRLRTENF